MKPGDKVEYIGRDKPELVGAKGTVTELGIDIAKVRFEGGVGIVACDPNRLSLVLSKEADAFMKRKSQWYRGCQGGE